MSDPGCFHCWIAQEIRVRCIQGSLNGDTAAAACCQILGELVGNHPDPKVRTAAVEMIAAEIGKSAQDVAEARKNASPHNTTTH